MKTTHDVLNVAANWLSTRAGKQADSLHNTLNSGDVSDLAKLKAAYEFIAKQRRQPVALMQWLKEAIEREQA